MRQNRGTNGHSPGQKATTESPATPSTDAASLGNRSQQANWLAVIVQLWIAIILLVATLIQAFVVVPSLRQDSSANDSQRMQADEDRRRAWERAEQERLLNESRKNIAIQQVSSQIAAERNRRISEENLRLSEELNKHLKTTREKHGSKETDDKESDQR